MQNTLSEIKKLPTSIDKVHESCYRSYHILAYVLTMVERGDNKETILDVVNHLQKDGISEERTTIE